MTISQTPSFLIEVLEGKPIPEGKKEYFRWRLKSRLHQLVVREYLRHEDLGLTQKEWAMRIGKGEAVVNRLLGAPGNWTLDTVSDLLLGLGAEPELAVHYFEQAAETTARIEALMKDQLSPPALGGSNNLLEIKPKPPKSDDFLKGLE